MTGSPALIDAAFALAERALAERALAERARQPGGALVLGISGPQGGGKSTTAAGVVARARAEGFVAVAVSIDDFYLTRAEQIALAARHPGNRYLEHRGYPGTHDVALGETTLQALRAARAGDAVALPLYDKGANGGRGDRAPQGTWPIARGPIDLIVLEGWMLGFPVAFPGPGDSALGVAAAHVGAYAPWTEALDAFVHLEADDPANIVAWRIDAEQKRRKGGAPALSDDEARDYIERFIPAYALWVPALRDRPPTRGGALLPSLWVLLGSDREPVSIRARWAEITPSAR